MCAVDYAWLIMQNNMVIIFNDIWLRRWTFLCFNFFYTNHSHAGFKVLIHVFKTHKDARRFILELGNSRLTKKHWFKGHLIHFFRGFELHLLAFITDGVCSVVRYFIIKYTVHTFSKHNKSILYIPSLY